MRKGTVCAHATRKVQVLAASTWPQRRSIATNSFWALVDDEPDSPETWKLTGASQLAAVLLLELCTSSDVLMPNAVNSIFQSSSFIVQKRLQFGSSRTMNCQVRDIRKLRKGEAVTDEAMCMADWRQSAESR